MPSNSFSDLDPRVPLPRAEVNRIGPGWDDPMQRADRVDPTLHVHVPPSPPPPVVASRPPPTDEQLRVELYECVTAMRYSNDQLNDAEATAERAAAHVEACRTRLKSFASLDATITTATVAALRSGEGFPRVGMDDDLRQLVRERDDARADLRAAEDAASVLNTALIDARADADQATQAARKAGAAVLGIEAEALAAHYETLLAEAATIPGQLAQFERMATGIGVGPLPASVLAVLRDPRSGVDLMRVIGTGEWSEKLNALLAPPED